jgi:hypothetical protein
MEQAEFEHQLIYKTQSMATLDESIEFNIDDLQLMQA